MKLTTNSVDSVLIFLPLVLLTEFNAAVHLSTLTVKLCESLSYIKQQSVLLMKIAMGESGHFDTNFYISESSSVCWRCKIQNAFLRF